MYEYPVWLLLFVIIPVSALWIWKLKLLRSYRKVFYYRFLGKNVKIIFLTSFVAVIYQLIIDPFAESWNAWHFSSEKILGIWILNFPVENTLFFILTSTATSSAVLTFIYYKKTGKLERKLKRIFRFS